MKVGLAQVNPCVADLEANVDRCCAAVTRAAAAGAELVVLPELAIPGCHPLDILLDTSFIDAVAAATTDFAKRIPPELPVLAGTVLRAEPRPPGHPGLLNVAALLVHGALQCAVAKRQLVAADVNHEPRWFLAGPECDPVEIAGRQVAILVGSERPLPGHAAADLQVRLQARHYCAGAGRPPGPCAARLGQVEVNLVGGNDELIFAGRSLAADRSGRLLARLVAFQEEVRVVKLGTSADTTCEPAASPQPWAAEVHAALVLGVRDFAAKNGIRRAVLGLSGGIDSALVAVIAADALGAGNVSALAMPSRYTDARSTEWAGELAASLGIGFEVVALEQLHRAAEQTLGPLLQGTGTAAENVQARLRALILMAHVNHHGGMLLCTSNKTELALGYGTLYGDLAGTLAPIGDLTKLQVQELARWINRERGLIPAPVLARQPTAELRPDQVDPFDYEIVAPAVEQLVLDDRSNAAMRRAEHKRMQSGVVLKVSKRSFGSGRLVPVSRR